MASSSHVHQELCSCFQQSIVVLHLQHSSVRYILRVFQQNSLAHTGIREYLIGPVLVLSLPGKQYELRRQGIKEAAEGPSADVSKLTWGDIRSRKVLDSSISGALAGGVLNTWKRELLSLYFSPALILL